MQQSLLGKKLVLLNEGTRFSAYKDSKGYATIAVGHLIVLPTDEWMLDTILTQDEVDMIYSSDLDIRENQLNKYSANWQEPIKQCEYDALLSFMWQYNITRYPNTYAAICSGDRQNIINCMNQFVNIVAGGGDNRLLPRRQREIAVFNGDYSCVQ